MSGAARALRPSLAALLASTCFGAFAARALDATWSFDAINGNWNDGANWTSTPPHAVPDGTATFGASAKTLIVFSQNATTIKEIIFTDNASAYKFTIVGGGQSLDITGPGSDFLVRGGIQSFGAPFRPIFDVQAILNFRNETTAGSSNIVNSTGGITTFFDQSIVEDSIITNDGGITAFRNQSQASGNSTHIINQHGGTTFFFDSSRYVGPVQGSIENTDGNSGTEFHGASSALGGILNNLLGGTTKFLDQSTANSITPEAEPVEIVNAIGGSTSFFDHSMAIRATITNKDGGLLSFFGNSSAGGASITNQTGAQTTFNDSATGATATINNVGGVTIFGAGTTAGSATITNGQGGQTLFFGNAGSATITNQVNGQTFFALSSLAGTAIINNIGGSTQFGDSSNADHATIADSLSGETSFFNSSTAGNAVITNQKNAGTLFTDQSDAGSATILNELGGVVVFKGSSNGGNAIITNDGGATTFVESSCPGNATITAINNGFITFAQSSPCPTPGPKPKIILGQGSSMDMSGLKISGLTLGSIEGFGTIFLGSKLLTVGSNDLSTEFAGVLSDGGASGGTGGSLIKTGQGALILSGTNTYTGGTTIDTGVLQLGNGGTSGSIIGNVVDNGVFAVNHSDTFTFGGMISGTGAFEQNGPGTTILTGINTYSGPTKVNAGTLQAGIVGALPATTALTVAPGAAFDLNGFDQSIGSLAGAGSVMLGAATLTTGNDGTSTAFAGVISGPGALTKTGDGIFTLTGTNTYSGGTKIAAGTLQLGNGGTSGSILGNVIDNAILAFNRSDTFTFGGVISGTGAVQQNGIGTTILTAASTYTGATDINAGALVVNGSLVSSVNVHSGGTLMGNGAIGGFNATSGSIIAPGNSIGTLNVAGNVTFSSGSTYNVEANAAGQADKIVAAGTAKLGGMVQVLAASGSYAPSTSYTILTAAGGVSNTFANVTSNLAFLDPSLSYTATSVLLTLARNTTLLASVAQTPNQRSVAQALNNFPTDNAIFQNVLTLSASSARQAFDALSGEAHADVQTTIVDDSRYVRQAVLGRLRQVPYAGASGPLAALGAGGPAFAYANERGGADASPVLAYAGSPAMVVKAIPGKASPEPPRYAYWAQGFGAWGKFGSDGNAGDVSRKFGGVVSGFDARFAGNWQAGLAAGYSQSNITIAPRSSSALVDTAHAALYAGTSVGAWNLRSGAAFAWHIIDTNRTVSFAGFFDQDKANYHAGTAQVFGEIGYGMALGSLALEPYAGIAHVHLGTQGFSETGGDAKLSAASGSNDTTYSSLGLRAAADFALASGMVFTPRVSAAWQHAFGAVTPSDTLTFQSTAVTFAIWGVPLAHDSALVDAGFDLRFTPNFKVGAYYSGQFASHVHDNAIKGDMTWSF